jgi:DmsE family decaheme c-type cytochrome
VAAVAARTGPTIPESPVVGASYSVSEIAGVEQTAKPSQTAPPAKPAATQPAAAGDYVGAEKCIECHEDQKKGYSDGVHGRTSHPRSPSSAKGCESCHGPGAKHSDDPNIPGAIRSFKKSEPPQEQSQACLTCHTRGNHAVWEGSVHDARKLSCATCHSSHAFKSENAQLKAATQRETCAACHRDKIAKLDRSGHMPVREGKLECSSCHNPHGSTNVKMLRRGDSIAESCTTCHAEKRGPYLWEHAPGRDGCTTCHDPHGSSNERMLVSKPPILCQRCHIATRHPSTIYDGALIGSAASPSVRIYARSCVTCHSAIHGSNHPSGQRFVR